MYEDLPDNVRAKIPPGVEVRPEGIALLMQDPDGYTVASNGTVIKHGKGGGFAVAPPKTQPHAITSANSHEMRARRAAKAQAVARMALDSVSVSRGCPQEIKDKLGGGGMVGWFAILQAQAERAASDHARSTEAARFVGQAAGLLDDQRKQAEEGTRTDDILRQVGGSVLVDLARRLREAEDA